MKKIYIITLKSETETLLKVIKNYVKDHNIHNLKVETKKRDNSTDWNIIDTPDPLDIFHIGQRF